MLKGLPACRIPCPLSMLDMLPEVTETSIPLLFCQRNEPPPGTLYKAVGEAGFSYVVWSWRMLVSLVALVTRPGNVPSRRTAHAPVRPSVSDALSDDPCET